MTTTTSLIVRINIGLMIVIGRTLQVDMGTYIYFCTFFFALVAVSDPRPGRRHSIAPRVRWIGILFLKINRRPPEI